jgi:hypothetical protein
MVKERKIWTHRRVERQIFKPPSPLKKFDRIHPMEEAMGAQEDHGD